MTGRRFHLKHSVDLVLLFAVLTCIPLDEGQRDLLREISRVLNRDLRNLERYDRYAEEYGIYGIFELTEGGVVRHYRKEWIEEPTGSFNHLEFESFEVRTMNGNKLAAFEYLCRALTSPNDSVDFDGFFAPRATLMSKAVLADCKFRAQWAFLTDNWHPDL